MSTCRRCGLASERTACSTCWNEAQAELAEARGALERELAAAKVSLSEGAQNLADHQAYIGGLREACDSMRAEIGRLKDHAQGQFEELAAARTYAVQIAGLLNRVTAIVELCTSDTDDDYDRALRPLIAEARAALAKNPGPSLSSRSCGSNPTDEAGKPGPELHGDGMGYTTHPPHEIGSEPPADWAPPPTPRMEANHKLAMAEIATKQGPCLGPSVDPEKVKAAFRAPTPLPEPYAGRERHSPCHSETCESCGGTGFDEMLRDGMTPCPECSTPSTTKGIT